MWNRERKKDITCVMDILEFALDQPPKDLRLPHLMVHPLPLPGNTLAPFFDSLCFLPISNMF
jgi:hypothetical protein